jgi:FkbM family methyltransferase
MLISFENVVHQIGKKPAGILHLGAHEGEESADYQRLGVEKVIWIEGNPVVFEKLTQKLSNVPGQQAFNILVSDKNEMVNFSIMNFDQSSSIMPIGVHKLHHPGIDVVKTVQLPAYRIEDYFSQHHVSLQDYDFLNIDLQGAELKALMGMGALLDQFNYIITEVNTTRIYKGCPVLPELDSFLYEKGFIRTKLELTKYQWGDALYERKPVPRSKFRVLHLQAKLIQFFSYRYYIKKKLARIVKKMIGMPTP